MEKTAAADVRPKGVAGVWDTLTNWLDRIGFTPLGAILLVILAILPFIPPFNQEHILRWLIAAAYLGAQAAAFDFTAGYINIVNFGFAAILGLGAYTSAILADSSGRLMFAPGLSPWITIFIGAIAAGLLGLLVGLLTLRLRGIFAAVMAWFVGLALIGITRNLTDLTRGPLGLHPPALLDTVSNRPYFYVILVMMVVVYVVLRMVTKSQIGLAFRAIGQNMDAARASGIDPTWYRVLNFTLSCFFAGLLGGFFAHYNRSLTPSTLMHTSKTVEVLAIAYIGGRGSLWGGIFTAFPFIFFIQYVRSSFTGLPGLHLVIYGILMILVMIYYPGGASQLIGTVLDRVKRRLGLANTSSESQEERRLPSQE